MLLAQLEPDDVGPALWRRFQPCPVALGLPAGNEPVGEQRGPPLLGLIEVLEKTAVDTVRHGQKHAGRNGDVDAENHDEQLQPQPRRSPLAKSTPSTH